MAVIVTGNCQLCRFAECVTVCPVACFHGDEQMLYVDPDVCVDCGACVPACPVKAIYFEHDLPKGMEQWIGINRDRAAELPAVTEQTLPLPGAAEKKAALGF
jgi:ferredoxin